MYGPDRIDIDSYTAEWRISLMCTRVSEICRHDRHRYQAIIISVPECDRYRDARVYVCTDLCWTSISIPAFVNARTVTRIR